MLKIAQASISDIPTIRDLADKTWWPTYSSLLPKEQIAFMLKAIYSAEALQKVMEEGSQTFLLLYDQGIPQGFASYGIRPENQKVSKLYKLYVLPQNQGKGYGRLLIDEVKNRLITLNIHTLDLNVKKDNPALSFYEKLGFKIIYEEEIPFGPYTLRDYVMRIEIAHQKF
jgi:diamine N-acetyltransferase